MSGASGVLIIAGSEVVQTRALVLGTNMSLTYDTYGRPQISAGATGFPDDTPMNFGSDTDYWFIYDSAGTQFRFRTTDGDGGGTDADIFTVQDGTDDIVFAASVGIGASVAQSGSLRLANGAWITARNNAGSADVNMIRVNSSNQIEFGAAIVLGTPLPVASGGTGVASWNAGGLIYASGSTTLTDTGTGLVGSIIYQIDSTSWAKLQPSVTGTYYLRSVDQGLEWASATSLFSLDSLSDVTISTPTEGQYLRKGAGNWINDDLDLTDGAFGPDDTFLATRPTSSVEWTTLTAADIGAGTFQSGNFAFQGGKVTFAASTTSYAAFRLTTGPDPTSPQAGDWWFDGTEMVFYAGVRRSVADLNAFQTFYNKLMSTGCTWQGNAVAVAYGGTGKTSWNTGGVVYASGSTTLTDSGSGSIGSIIWNIDGSSWTQLQPPASGVYYLQSSSRTLSWAAGGSVSELDDLTDVTMGTPSTGDYLRYSGSYWTNSSIDEGDIDYGADDTFLVTRGTTVQWGTIGSGDLPAHTHDADDIGGSTEAARTFASSSKYTFSGALDVDGALVCGSTVTITSLLTISGNAVVYGQAYPNDFYFPSSSPDQRDVTGSLYLDWDGGNVQGVSMGAGSLTIYVDSSSNMKEGGAYTLLVFGPSSGSQTLSISGVDTWAGDGNPSGSMSSGSVHLINFIKLRNRTDGADYVVGVPILDGEVIPV